MDIVEALRLRPEREMLYLDGCVAAGYGPTIEAQAADEIERLRADLDAARYALAHHEIAIAALTRKIGS